MGPDAIGIVAGGGRLPIRIAQAAKEKGMRVVVVAHEGETSKDIEAFSDATLWIRLGQLGGLIKALKAQRIQKAVFAGTVQKKRMFQGLRPDLKGLALMARMAIFHDDQILRSVAKELFRAGIEVLPSTILLPELVAVKGILTKKRPTKAQQEDIRLGWQVAKEIGRLDIGQTVVVKDRVIVAVEALEGTDETIKRGAALAPGCVVVKVSKPQQDLRFDLPTVGLNTVQVMQEYGASLLCIEAGKTIIMERAEMLAFADQKGLCILARE